MAKTLTYTKSTEVVQTVILHGEDLARVEYNEVLTAPDGTKVRTPKSIVVDLKNPPQGSGLNGMRGMLRAIEAIVEASV